jgi:hypothetical protein
MTAAASGRSAVAPPPPVVAASSDADARAWVAAAAWRFRDRWSAEVYNWNGSDLAQHGLVIDLPAWGYHLFEVEQAAV